MSYEDELINVTTIARELTQALRIANTQSDSADPQEVAKLLPVLERWLHSLERSPGRGEIDDVWYDLKNEVQFLGWGTTNDSVALTQEIRDLQDEFYEAMVFLIDELKQMENEEKTDIIRQRRQTRRI